MYEPLMIGIVLPFIRSSPAMRRVIKEEDLEGGSVLFQFLLDFERIRTMPEEVVRKMLYFKS